MEVLRKIICILLLFNVYTAKAQLDILRFSTFYASYSTNTPQIGDPSFMVQGTEPDNPYDFVPNFVDCLLYTSPSPRDRQKSRMPSSA